MDLPQPEKYLPGSGKSFFVYNAAIFSLLFDSKYGMVMSFSFVRYRFIHIKADKNPYFGAINPFKTPLKGL